MLCISEAYAVVLVRPSACPSICLSVHLPVTFVYCVKTSNHILRLFSPSASYIIMFFLYQTLWQYSDGYPLMGASYAWGMKKSRFFYKMGP